ncbi:MAG: hypothetical protein V4717_11525 [Bacteroidota bacterium]
MKTLLPLILLFVIGCKSDEKKEALSMPGAYKQVSQRVKSKDLDTTYNDFPQLKIFTGDYMMYANINTPDSLSGFGIGSYTINSDTVIERVIYNAFDSSKTDSVSSYTLLVTKTPKGYSQLITGMQSQTGPIDLTEEYEAVGTNTTSPLDGAWKLVKVVAIRENDTTNYETTQFKTYGNGHFIWGNTWADSTKKTHTAIGFGTFTMNGNKVTESVTASTYYDVRGTNVNIDIEMNGKDAFTQIITNDGTKIIESFERLKE